MSLFRNRSVGVRSGVIVYAAYLIKHPRSARRLEVSLFGCPGSGVHGTVHAASTFSMKVSSEDKAWQVCSWKQINVLLEEEFEPDICFPTIGSIGIVCTLKPNMCFPMRRIQSLWRSWWHRTVLSQYCHSIVTVLSQYCHSTVM